MASADDSARKRALQRAAKLRALAEDRGNVNEAAAARARLDALVGKWGFTDAEFVEVTRQPSRPRRAGGGKDRWRQALAVEIGKKYGCRALSAKGEVFFEGEAAVEAVVMYRRVAADIDDRSALDWLSAAYQPQLKGLYQAIYHQAVVRGFASPRERADLKAAFIDPEEHRAALDFIKRMNYASAFWSLFVASANELGHRAGAVVAVGVEAVSVAGAEPPPPSSDDGETFAATPGFVSVRGNQPGNFATLFTSDGERHFIRGDLCRFDDQALDYTWVFACVPPPGPLVFATARVDAVAEVIGARALRTTRKRAKMDRNLAGEPLRVLEIVS